MTDLFSSERLTFCRGRELFAQDKLILADAMTTLLTPKVAEPLPIRFHGINNRPKALLWLQQTLAESELLVVQLKPARQIIAVILLHSAAEGRAAINIGYLLAEQYWGKGYATEMLTSLIRYYKHSKNISCLNAGVAADNRASISLLEKCGFCQVKNHDNKTLFYHLKL
ncbi:GNAT family N-acetyltransferase [Thalassomonas actiniarum]|uniref:GNAT family N-acetyltransferase n=1 Tax=Thalassomonas actiniarum TaxID=485447 RepID=A0AAE9YXX5_9GAMM|nr:GNAT family N-acetyltransferase [Thalassomonas actiniarum]WDE01637.1 GNAT family N-acetyltransferase [Thalassomonas actiniarum]